MTLFYRTSTPTGTSTASQLQYSTPITSPQPSFSTLITEQQAGAAPGTPRGRRLSSMALPYGSNTSPQSMHDMLNDVQARLGSPTVSQRRQSMPDWITSAVGIMDDPEQVDRREGVVGRGTPVRTGTPTRRASAPVRTSSSFHCAPAGTPHTPLCVRTTSPAVSRHPWINHGSSSNMMSQSQSLNQSFVASNSQSINGYSMPPPQRMKRRLSWSACSEQMFLEKREKELVSPSTFRNPFRRRNGKACARFGSYKYDIVEEPKCVPAKFIVSPATSPTPPTLHQRSPPPTLAVSPQGVGRRLSGVGYTFVSSSENVQRVSPMSRGVENKDMYL